MVNCRFERGEFYDFLKSERRLNHALCVDQNNIINTMFESGMDEGELLKEEYLDVVDKWLLVHKPFIKSKDAKRRYRYAVCNYRIFKGI